MRVQAGGGWWASEREDIEIPYDAGKMRDLIRWLQTSEYLWQMYFYKRKIHPLELTYEELTAEPERVVRRVLGFLGIGEFRPTPPKSVKQAGADVEHIVRQWRAQEKP